MPKWFYDVKSNLMMNNKKEYVLRNLVKTWADFELELDNVEIIKKINNDKFRLEDYKKWLLNQRQQVIEGGRWIARSGSSITNKYEDIRSKFLKHAATEHLDYKMLEANYISIGGQLEDIKNYPKNLGTEIFSAYMFQKASEANPFGLLGAMFIIEGLGQNKATKWGEKIKDQLHLKDEQVSFLLYHGENDQEHMEEFDKVLDSGILEISNMAEDIIRTAKIVGKLYIMQLNEIENN